MIKVFITVILIFLIQTGNVFSNTNIFDVDNIELNNLNDQNREKLLNTSIKKGFNQLMQKILQKKYLEAVSNLSLKEIKKMISSYQIIEKKENTNGEKTLVNLSFDRVKINEFFYKKNILYADVSKTDVIILPILIKDDKYFIYSNNYFFNNWNNEKYKKQDEFINYILPTENLEDIQFIINNKDKLESLELKNFFSSYEIKDTIFLAISSLKNKTDIFLKAQVSGNDIIKNYSFQTNFFKEDDKKKFIIETVKAEIEEIWKSQNLIDVRTPSFLNIYFRIKNQNDLLSLTSTLSKIDLIENYQVLELTKKYAKVKIKYFGKISKIKNKFTENDIKVNIINSEWKLGLN